VLDQGAGLVTHFDAVGNFQGQWSGFVFPYGIAVSPTTGLVYVSDLGADTVFIFTPTGAQVGQFGSPGDADGQFDLAHRIAVAPTGDIYVTDAQSGSPVTPLHDRVVPFAPGGAPLPTWGSSGTGDGQFTNPQGVAVAGFVYVAESDGARRVQYFLANGTFVGTFQATFTTALGVAVSPVTGTVYVTDIGEHVVKFFDPLGNLLGVFGGSGTGEGQFNTPWGVAISPITGWVYVADSANRRIQVFCVQGT